MHWSDSIERPMPWENEKNPYFVWLSEVILQQTRVEQGLPYYLKFIKKYPTIKSLAEVSESTLMKDWEGLGYYSRARNLQSAAITIMKEYNGEFPKKYDDIKKLKGVGTYTAAAIASFAYDLPYAVLDGNVFRVLSRVLGIHEFIDTSNGKKLFQSIAQDYLDPTCPAKYNQAIMNFGAMQCLPKSPNCVHCVMNPICKAYKLKTVDELPKKSKKLEKKLRHIHYLVFKNNKGYTLVTKTKNSVWKGLFQFPYLESKESYIDTLPIINYLNENNLEYTNIKKLFSASQQLTHQKINASFWQIETTNLPNLENTEKVSFENINGYAYPKIIKNFLSSILNK